MDQEAYKRIIQLEAKVHQLEAGKSVSIDSLGSNSGKIVATSTIIRGE